MVKAAAGGIGMRTVMDQTSCFLPWLRHRLPCTNSVDWQNLRRSRALWCVRDPSTARDHARHPAPCINEKNAISSTSSSDYHRIECRSGVYIL
jgi:hypothetical protein